MSGIQQRYDQWKVLWRHFCRVQGLRFHISKDAARQAIQPDLVDGLPVPPAYLIYLVGGNTNANAFLHGGLRVGRAIRETLAKNNLRMEDFTSVLDFGCGCGRGIRQWQDVKGTKFFGSDYNAMAIRWCRANLRFARFDVNRLAPPMRYADSAFDFIYAFSVFTHFTEELQFAWMAELRRLLSPKGHLLITVHGPSFLHVLGQYHQDQFRAGKMVVLSEFAAGTNLTASFHPEEYVRNTLGAGFDVLDRIPEAIEQDFYLLRKR